MNNIPKAASKREQDDARIGPAEREQARRLHRQRMMMLDIDGVLTHHDATPIDVLTAAQALATSAVGDLVNKSAVPDNNVQWSMYNGQCSMVNGQCSMVNGQCSMVNGQSIEALHRFADGIADQIRAALHARIDLGHRPDW